MTLQDVMVELCEGNPGALTVLIEMTQRAQLEDTMTSLMFLFAYMKETGLTGSEIWILYKDECDKDMDLFLNTLALQAEAHAITFEAGYDDAA